MTAIRVFPRRTSYTPTDPYAFVGDPPLWIPPADEVHVSCTFTWDIPEAKRLAEAWDAVHPIVRIGGPVFNDGLPMPFEPGVFVKPGVTFTTRGCIRRCPWCLVPQWEGTLRLIQPIQPGYIVQDNNLLAAPLAHIAQVFKMLRAQPRAAVFAGGLDVRMIDQIMAEELCSMRIQQAFLACDDEEMLTPLQEATNLLAPLGRDKLRCYVLLGFGEDTPEKAERRLKEVWKAGAMPFAQLYQPPTKRIKYDYRWRELARTWSRPAATKAVMS